MSVQIIDNSDMVLKALQSSLISGLEECGMVGESYAKSECPVNTGNLRNSISHKVVDGGEKFAAIGTNTYYAPYVEFGTGKYSTLGGGRPTPWVYQDGEGHWHRTSGSKDQPFIKPAVANHRSEYQDIIHKHMKGL